MHALSGRAGFVSKGWQWVGRAGGVGFQGTELQVGGQGRWGLFPRDGGDPTEGTTTI